MGWQNATGWHGTGTTTIQPPSSRGGGNSCRGRSWFAGAGFGEEAFDISHDGFMSVGAHRLTGEPAALMPGQRLFTFVART